MLKLLAASNGRQINATLTAMLVTLANEGGIRSHEAVQRHGEGKKSRWTAGPRCTQALHVAKIHQEAWWDEDRNREKVTDVAPDAPGPKLVLRTTFCEGDLVEFNGGRGALGEALEDDALTNEARRWMTPDEVFIERIDGTPQTVATGVPAGYGEHGI